MIVRSFDDSDSGGFDIRNYGQINLVSMFTQIPIDDPDNKITILEINGAGFLTEAVHYGHAEHSMIVTIDGVGYTYSNPSTTNSVGITMRENIIPTSTGSVYTTIAGTTAIIPLNPQPFVETTHTYSGQLAVISVPLFFESSLKIEIAEITENQYFKYSIMGGVEI